jgi:hypothetical protein
LVRRPSISPMYWRPSNHTSPLIYRAIEEEFSQSLDGPIIHRLNVVGHTL